MESPRSLSLFGSLLSLVLWGAACGPEGNDRYEGDPARRYEPAMPVDVDNVVDFGASLTQIKLPPPPRSGFRIVVPPQTLAPGEERLYCVSWPFPAMKNRIIYAGRLYTTAGLHHSNVISKPFDEKRGRNPYPRCHPGASDPFRDLPRIIPDVLFGNSTQLSGEESLVFPEGMGFQVDPDNREISTNIHLLNPSDKELRVEVAYDFFTMDRAQLVSEVAPFQFSVNGFLLRPGERRTVASECDVFGGELISLMLHTHNLAQRTQVIRRRENAEDQMLYDEGAFDYGSRIRVYKRGHEGTELWNLDRLRFSCEFHNTTNHDVTYGLGENEMCVLFGYITPPEKQLVGWTDDESKPCRSIQIGAFRK